MLIVRAIGALLLVLVELVLGIVLIATAGLMAAWPLY
jgi:hypothetical protein